jgi:methionyl-tRNA formyltransferase
VKIVVIGAVQFTLAMLKTIIETNHQVVGVITSNSAGINSDYVDLMPFCTEHNIPAHKTDDINSRESIAWVKIEKADVVLCLGWSRLIKQEMLGAAPLGVIGYHPALLPKNRGRHPLIWALALGLKKTGSTFFFMNEDADSGDILSQSVIKINEDDDASSLYRKMTLVAEKQLVEFLPRLEDESYTRTPQDYQLSNTWRKRGKKDGEIDWRMSARTIHNLVRALTHPYVGAHFMHEGKEYKVWSASPDDDQSLLNIEPGKVLAQDSGVTKIRCYDGCINLQKIEPPFQVQEGTYL